MTYQNVLPFDENYAWTNLIKNLKKLSQVEKIVYYGIAGRKITFRKLSKEYFLVTSYSMQSLAFNIEHEGNLRFIEVEFMSKALINKHLHIYEKAATSNIDWRLQVYRCKDPNCHHYTQAQYIEGKAVRCFKCQETTTVLKTQLWKRNKHITCLDCSKSPRKHTARIAAQVTENLLDTLFSDPILDQMKKEEKENK